MEQESAQHQCLITQTAIPMCPLFQFLSISVSLCWTFLPFSPSGSLLFTAKLCSRQQEDSCPLAPRGQRARSSFKLGERQCGLGRQAGRKNEDLVFSLHVNNSCVCVYDSGG